jgi:Arc/MetJ family transcription regulator
MAVVSGKVAMRTNIELDDNYRRRVMELAARRGKKGISDLVNEAVGRYLSAEDMHADKQRKALHVQNFLDPDEADDLALRCQIAQQLWRTGDEKGP